MLTESVLNSLTTALSRDLFGFIPELLVSTAIVLMLMLRLFKGMARTHMGGVALFFTLLALLITGVHCAVVWMQLPVTSPVTTFDVLNDLGRRDGAFGGMIVADQLTNFLRLVLLGFAALMVWFSRLTGIPDRDDSADFYTLLLGATLGMMLMGSANHLLMVFIAVEMASVPSYALAGFLKGRRQSSEAALKYVVYGGGASGVMLYGISLVAGRYGTGYIPDLAQAIQAQMSAGGTGIAALDTMVLLGLVFILAGLAFKLSAVPFHFWCPDVFEGAAAEIGAFLSVASKAAALVLTGRLLLTLAGAGETGLVVVMPKTFVPVLAFFAALTATFGNLAAYAQTNLKRLLAYSTIAHAGYMLMGLATMTDEGLSSVLFYIVAYVFMNLGAFAMVAFLRNKTGSEDLSSFRGLVYRSPLLVVLFGVFLISLLGLPPLAGFTAKFQVFAAVYHAGEGYMPTSPALGYTMYALLLIGGINTVFSLFYYLKVLRVMVLEKPLEEMENRPAAPLPLSAGATVFAGFLAAMIFVAGVAFDPLATAADKGAMNFSTLTGALPTGQVARPGAGGGGGPAPGGPRPGGGAPGGGARPGGGQPKGNNPAQPKGKTAP